MADKKGFDLASVLGDVSKLNTGSEQIVMIPLDRIDPDERNFYSLEGLEDLAGNIELIGLQQPLRVRPAGDRYVVVSGHRRRAAIMLIQDGGSEQFKDGVPCIVEYGDASPAMQELRLIYANSMTRDLTAAELSKQAERVTELLYQLKEQGVEFPGRMRAHVAQACQVSASKLARLHAIRSHLDEGWLAYFDRGELSEDAAYNLSRLPAEIQQQSVELLASGKKKRIPTAAVIRKVYDNLQNYSAERSCRAHAGGPQCHFLAELPVINLFEPYEWNACSGSGCCMNCVSRHSCSKKCKEAKDRDKLEKAVQAEKDAEREKSRQAEREATKKRVIRRAKALLPLIEAAGLKDDELLYSHYSAATVSDVKSWAAGGAANKTFYSEDALLPYFSRDIMPLARKLHVSPEKILEPWKKDPEPLKPEWQRGEPPRSGKYYALLVDSNNPKTLKYDAARKVWSFCGSGGQLASSDVCGWWPLPEV